MLLQPLTATTVLQKRDILSNGFAATVPSLIVQAFFVSITGPIFAYETFPSGYSEY